MDAKTLAENLSRVQERLRYEAAQTARLRAEVRRLREALAFAQSAIKSGEPWTTTCEEVIGGALGHAR